MRDERERAELRRTQTEEGDGALASAVAAETLGDTLEIERDKASRAAAPFVDLGPMLVRLACAHDVQRPSARYRVDPYAEVVICRSRERFARWISGALVIAIEDRYASSRHVRLLREGRSWVALDEGSRNGTFVNGRRLATCERFLLPEEALIELGHTFFLFRASVPGPPEARTLSTAYEEVRESATLNLAWEYELARLRKLAPTRHEVLLEGESGCGKEILARWIHEASGRRGRLVSLNCAALPESLLDDELFGHLRGAFSDAQAHRPGLIRAAHEGTLFLDEIGDMPAALQAKLLRVLEDGKVRPIGGERDVEVDVRVLAATHRSLRALVAAGRFREDLLARVGLLRFRLPAVRERREDLGLLIRAVLRDAPEVRFEVEALRMLLMYSWPLNVRELRRVLLVAADLAPAVEDGARLIAARHLSLASAASDADSGAPASRARELTPDEKELRDRIAELLRSHRGNVAAVARVLGKPRTRVQRLMARLEIDRAGASTRSKVEE